MENQGKPSNTKYKILFYGTYESNVLKADAFVPFNKESLKKYGEPRKYKSFNEAMDEIQNDPHLEVLSHEQASEEEPEPEDHNEVEEGNQDERDDLYENESRGEDINKSEISENSKSAESKKIDNSERSRRV